MGLKFRGLTKNVIFLNFVGSNFHARSATAIVKCSLASQPLFLPALLVRGVVIRIGMSVWGPGKQEKESGIT